MPYVDGQWVGPGGAGYKPTAESDAARQKQLSENAGKPGYDQNGYVLRGVQQNAPQVQQAGSPVSSAVQSLSSSLGSIMSGAGGSGGSSGGGSTGTGTPAPAPPAGAPSTSVNTAAANPDIAYAIGEMKKREAGDNGAGEAMDMANSKARDVGTGLMREAAAGRSSRGVSGTGADSFDTRNIIGGVQKNIASADADIALNRQAQKDATLTSIAGAGTQQAQVQQAQQDNAERQWEAGEAIRQRQEDANAAREMSLLNILMQQTALAA